MKNILLMTLLQIIRKCVLEAMKVVSFLLFVFVFFLIFVTISTTKRLHVSPVIYFSAQHHKRYW